MVHNSSQNAQSEMPDFLYENAPLIEVVAEVHWELAGLSAIPNGAVDPFYQPFQGAITDCLKRAGYGFEEQILPPDVPLELVPHNVVKRFRSAPNKWPVFQIGPGLFTINAIPPYGGWGKFREGLNDGFSWLFAAYLNLGKAPKIKKAELKYIDAFVSPTADTPFSAFLADTLKMKVEIPQSILADAITPEQLMTTTEVVFPLKSLKDAVSVIKAGPGQKDQKNALLLETLVRAQPPSCPQSANDAVLWFDKAHEIIGKWFQELTTEAAKNRMGPRKSIEGQ